MTIYNWADKADYSKGMVTKDGAALAYRDEVGLSKPEIIPDMPPHIGPSGRYISSRSEYEDELKRTGSVPRDWGMKNDVYGYLTDGHARAAGKTVNPEEKERWLEDKKKAYAAADIPFEK